MNPQGTATAIVVEHHEHGALIHDHLHAHITHYLLYGTSMEHLVSRHEHEHNHAAVAHEHSEQQRHAAHEREAHIHDHGHPAS